MISWVRGSNLVGRKSKFTASKAYSTWARIRKRCYSAMDKDYRYYGGRGIAMCDEWLDDFPAFREWAIRNGIARDKTIDRIDNDGNYEPGNCQWIPQSEQSKNRSMSKLTEDAVLEIRRHDGPPQEMMEKYGIAMGHYYKVRRGERWSELGEAQPQVRKCDRVMVEWRSRRVLLSDLAKQFGMSPRVVRVRHIVQGWPLERALTEPLRDYSFRDGNTE